MNKSWNKQQNLCKFRLNLKEATAPAYFLKTSYSYFLIRTLLTSSYYYYIWQCSIGVGTKQRVQRRYLVARQKVHQKVGDLTAATSCAHIHQQILQLLSHHRLRMRWTRFQQHEFQKWSEDFIWQFPNSEKRRIIIAGSQKTSRRLMSNRKELKK